jgi:hypothetical protein
MVGDSFFQPLISFSISNGNLPFAMPAAGKAIAISTFALPSPEILNKLTHDRYRSKLSRKE